MIFRLSSILVAITLFAGCASAAPQGYKAGYKAKRGTQKPYKIDGKWYTPVESSYGFDETGLASWYGKDFHGKKTSNGETYDMYAMTAAHKTLPMNTYVRVVRLDDGRETVVRVNDRGPFVRGRIIDLSFTAAKKLGIDVQGTARVKIIALGDKTGDRLVKRNYDSGSFYIQVGAFTVKDNALRLRDQLKREYGGAMISNFYNKGTTFYRVRIGPIKGLDQIKGLLHRVERSMEGSPFIVAD